MKPILPPERSPGSANNVPALTRAIVAHRHQGADAQRAIETELTNDRRALEMAKTRSTALPAGVGGNAAPFQSTVLADIATWVGPKPTLLGNLLDGNCVKLSFDGQQAVVHIPSGTVSGSGVVFVPPAGPIPVGQESLSGINVTPRSAKLIEVMTAELMASSNAEPLLRALIGLKLKYGLEGLMLDTNGDDGIRPPGIRSGIAAIGATVPGALQVETDIMNVCSAVSDYAGGIDGVIIITTPALALRISILLPLLKVRVLASPALPANVLIGLATDALCVGGGDEIKFSVSNQGVVEMADSNPAQFSISGSPNVAAANLRSLWQTNTQAIRLTFDIGWGIRSASGVAWCTVLWGA